MINNTWVGSLLATTSLAISISVQALPALQLGDGSGSWTYDNSDESWVTDDQSFTLNAYANSDTEGAHGNYAWDSAGSTTQTAYLVFAAVPSSLTDSFDISVSGDSGALTFVTNGYGAPPLEDSNSLAPHGIYDTYFEIYSFQFDGSVTTINDTQPGETGSGDGYAESINVVINSMAADLAGIHMDLFTLSGDSIFDIEGNEAVNAFAPFSHDAEFRRINEPATAGMLVLALLGLAYSRRGRI